MNNKERYKQRASLSDSASIWKNEGKVCFHGDAYKHYLIKAATGYILRKNDHVFTTELEFENGRIADVMDLNTFIVYELESNFSNSDYTEKVDNFREYENVKDVIVFDPQEAPNDLSGIKDWLEEKLVL